VEPALGTSLLQSHQTDLRTYGICKSSRPARALVWAKTLKRHGGKQDGVGRGDTPEEEAKMVMEGKRGKRSKNNSDNYKTTGTIRERERDHAVGQVSDRRLYTATVQVRSQAI
jgi:hypothetical protein